MPLPLAPAYAFLLVLLRVTGLALAGPFFSSRVVAGPVRLAFSLVVAFAVWGGAGAPAVAPPAHLWSLVAAMACETAVGVLGGLAARWTLQAALSGGYLAGLSAGLGFGALVDPSSGAESTAISEVIFNVAQASALALGLHREAVAWLARSVAAWPPGGALPIGELAERAMGHAVLSIALSVRLAFPVIGAVMLGHAVVSLVGRVAPQLSLANVGFSVSILAGGFALYLVAPAAAEMAARASVAAFGR